MLTGKVSAVEVEPVLVDMDDVGGTLVKEGGVMRDDDGGDIRQAHQVVLHPGLGSKSTTRNRERRVCLVRKYEKREKGERLWWFGLVWSGVDWFLHTTYITGRHRGSQVPT